jgi:site-specific DNA-cytosine methylase
VVFACDHSEDALATHAANHPDAEHLQAELPLPRSKLPFPKDGRPFHVHGSPPCTLFSSMNTKSHGAVEARHAATNLVRWYLKTALASGCTSWSMEQVPSKAVRAVVERFRLKHRATMDYGVFEFYDLGVPQRRKRLLAGSPALIARLKRLACHARRRSVRDVLGPEARGTHIRTSLRWEKKRLRHDRKPGESKYVYVKSPDPLHSCAPITGPAPTVVTTSALTWVTRDAETEPALTPRELAALQCFPADYKLPETSAREAQLIVGNSVPPLVARLMMGGR